MMRIKAILKTLNQVQFTGGIKGFDFFDMKAKAYAKRYKRLPTDNTLKEIILDFMSECDDLVKRQSVKTDEAATTVLDEQNQKWKTFARIINKEARVTIIREDGFEQVLRDRIPELYQAWKRHKMFIEVRKAAKNARFN